MNRNGVHFPREELETMPSQKLDEILCAELESDDINKDLVLMVIEILESREAEELTTNHPKVQEAGAIYQAWNSGINVGREEGRRPRRRLAVTAVAAVVLLVFCIAAPQTLGAEDIFDLIARWTETFFGFEATEGKETQLPEPSYVFRTDNPGLQELYDTMTELGITQPVVPQWLPEGYMLAEIIVDKEQKLKKVYACFLNGSQEIVIVIRSIAETFSPSYFKDYTDIEIHECGSMIHYIMRNENITQIVWYAEHVECLYSMTDESDLYQILGSLYSEE